MNILFFLLLLVLVLAIAGTIIGGIITLIGWAIVGLVIGALARLAVRGTSGLGLFRTILCGIAGAIGGGLLASALDLGDVLEFVASIVVAALLVSFVTRDDRGSTVRELR
jgi:uncharacterized membrane protein YeaQ/YmgE (transglycosylase-associated protein family)